MTADGTALTLAELVRRLRAGRRLPLAEIRMVLEREEVTAETLLELVFVGATEPAPGDPCPRQCGGRLGVVCSRRLGDYVVRTLACRVCGGRPLSAKQVLPGETVPRRRRREVT